MKALPYIFIVFAYFVGYFTHHSRHTCPTTYPTRNEMLEFLRDYGYTGDYDGEIGTGGNKAWGLYEGNLNGVHFMNQAIGETK